MGISLRRVAWLCAAVGGLVVGQFISAAAQPAESTYRPLGFAVLAAYPIDSPAVNSAPVSARTKAADEQIPRAIRQWDRRQVEVSGFMMPVRVQKGLVTEFLLMRFTAAAMNTTAPAVNEWVLVRANPGVTPSLEFPVTCRGVFKVGPVFENGYLTAVYQLEAEKVILPQP